MSDDLTCVILAGGLGTRLRAALPDLPKPMAPVNGRPFLEYLLAQVRQAGVRDVVLSVGYRAEAIAAHFGEGERFGVRIRYAREQEPLGTAGALVCARPLIASDPFLVMNGDSYCGADLVGLVNRHRERGALATLVITRVQDRSQYGSVLLRQDDAVAGFAEKAEASGEGWINGGIYALSRAVLDRVPAGVACSIEREVFPQLVGHGLYAYRGSGLFLDIGTPDRLAAAQRLLPPLGEVRP